MKKQNEVMPYIMELVTYKKGMFITSVVLAICNAVLLIIPYIMLSGIGDFTGILDRLVFDVQNGQAFDAGFYWLRLGVMIGCVVLAPILKFIS